MSAATPTPARDEERLELSLDPASAFETLLGALGEGAIVREEDDGIPRFAGVRTVVIRGRRNDSLSFMRGGWGEIKKRTETPMATVHFEPQGSGCVAQIAVEKRPAPGAAAKLVSWIVDLVSVALTIGILAYAVNNFRGLSVDWTRLALIAFGGALLYTIARQFMGSDPDDMEGPAWLRMQILAALRPTPPESEQESEPEPVQEPAAEPADEAEAERAAP